MATTTNYSWTTPDDTDLVKDGASAIRTLGSSADTTVKDLNPGTTAGDIDYYTSSTAKARVAIGTAGQVLQVNAGATAPEWATPAAGGAFTSIASGTLSGSSVTISSIPATYRDLRLVIIGYRPANDGAAFMVRFNGDTGNNYRPIGASISDTGAFFDPSIYWTLGQDNGTSNSLGVATIYEYANTTSWKFIFGDSITNFATTPTEVSYVRRVGSWGNTSAISSIDMLPTSGNFTSGSYNLYGVK